MLDDHRRKAVATIEDFGHRASLPSASLPSYPVTLTKPRRPLCGIRLGQLHCCWCGEHLAANAPDTGKGSVNRDRHPNIW